MRKIFISIFIFIYGAISCSCASLPPRKNAEKACDVGNNQVILVGKIILHPPLGEKEQKIVGLGADSLINGILIINDYNWKNFTRNQLDVKMGQTQLPELWLNRIEAKIGETFFSICTEGSLYLFTGMICLDASFHQLPPTFTINYDSHNVKDPSYVMDYIYLPLDVKVNIKAGDKAVYMGTIHIYRDEFNNVEKIVQEDNYNQEIIEFRKKFGNMPLRKSLYINVNKKSLIK